MKDDYFSYTAETFDRSKVEQKSEALKGIRVLDLSHMIFGPKAANILAEHGAEVIKVEVPYQGDYWRSSTYWGKYWKHSNPMWHFINHSKYFVGIDVKYPRGKELILELAGKSDIVIENFASGTVEAWGIGYTQVRKINPKIIYASMSTFGQSGPARFFPGWDLLAQGASGVISGTGYPDTEHYFKVPDFYGDFYPGFFAAMTIMMALNYRESTGEGQYLDVCQTEILMRTLFNFTYSSVTGDELGRTGNHDPTAAPSGIFKTADGIFFALAIVTDKQFRSLCAVLGRENLAEDERFATALERLKKERAEELDSIVGNWIGSKRSEELRELTKSCAFPLSEVLDDVQLANDDWRRERGSVVEFDDEMYKKLVMAGSAAMMSKTPGRIKWLTRPLGYHNRYILKTLLGLSEKEICKLEEERIVGTWDYRVGQRPPVYYDIEKDTMFNYDGKGGEDN
ncbi:MAG: CoA transferase [Syntrophobacterales bacterium]|nr:MAG: CoA transferase [Syntrophobacterales bacterium]